MIVVLLDYASATISNNTDWVSNSLSVIKFVSAIAAALFAVFGVVGKTLTDDGKLTHWGKLSILGIVLSLFLGLITQSLESKRENATRMNEERKEANTRRKEQRKLAADIKIQSLTTARIERLLIRTDSINKGLSRTSQQQKDALDSLGLALSFLQASSFAQSKLLNNSTKLNADLSFTIGQQRKLLSEQKYTRQDLYKVMNPINSWSIHTEITYKVYDMDLIDYFNRIKAKSQSIKSSDYTPGIFINNMLSRRFNSKHRSDRIQILTISQGADSTWFPNCDKEYKASMLLNEQSINLGFITTRKSDFEKNHKPFFSMKSDIKDILRVYCVNKSSNLYRRFISHSPKQRDSELEFSLEINFDQLTITQHVTSTVFSDNRTHGMKSLADFSGISMEMVFGYMRSFDESKSNSVSVDWVQILLNNDLNSQFDIYEKDIVLAKNGLGHGYVWKYNFPIQFPE